MLHVMFLFSVDKNLNPVKTLLDTDWSDKEWSNDSDSSDDEGKETTAKPLETPGEDPLAFFGLPAQDVGSQTRLDRDTPQKSAGLFPSRKITPITMETRMEHISQESGGNGGRPSSWKELLHPCRKYITQVQSKFPEEWFDYLTRKLHTDGSSGEDEFRIYRDIVMCCYAVINVCGLHGNVLKAGPAHINRVFQDRISWSPEVDLLEQDLELKELVLKAYR